MLWLGAMCALSLGALGFEGDFRFAPQFTDGSQSMPQSPIPPLRSGKLFGCVLAVANSRQNTLFKPCLSQEILSCYSTLLIVHVETVPQN